MESSPKLEEELSEYDIKMQRELILGELRKYEDEQGQWRKETKRSVQAISAVLLANKCLEKGELGEEETFKKLFTLTHIRLEDCNIEQIDNLDTVHQATHLSLQHNQIRVIEELEWLTNLVHLDLSHNRITTVEGLDMLANLTHLNLSHNPIDHLDVEEIPRSVTHIDLRGCPLISEEEAEEQIRGLLQHHLENLQVFNGGDGEILQNTSKKSVLDVEVATTRNRLIAEHEEKCAERRNLVDRIYNADVENAAFGKVLEEEHKRFSSVFGEGGGGGGEIIEKKEEGNISLSSIADHQKKAGAALIDDKIGAFRESVKQQKMQMLQRSVARREKLASNSSDAFIKATELLTRDANILLDRKKLKMRRASEKK